MSAPRTVTVPTLDHGDIVIPEPAWCAGHDGQPPQYRIDIGHTGPERELIVPTSRGPVPLMVTAIEQRPFIGDRFPGTAPLVWLGISSDGYPSSPAQLDQLANALVGHAATLRALARRLAVLRIREGR
ncbi:hypothetical protein [Streptomyces sp. NPDC005407]|uniref:DUF6907 domain-containing protein n=1 Tax=Streptomyces sp. NPDC005407 TaxID=3155340 RepID=UPI0033A24D2C